MNEHEESVEKPAVKNTPENRRKIGHALWLAGLSIHKRKASSDCSYASREHAWAGSILCTAAGKKSDYNLIGAYSSTLKSLSLSVGEKHPEYKAAEEMMQGMVVYESAAIQTQNTLQNNSQQKTSRRR